MPCAFFSVCLGVLQDEPKVQKEVNSIVQKFFEELRWSPRQWAVFAGGLPFSKYNLFYKFLMKRIASQAGQEVKTSQDYEYTNWSQVDLFIDKFANEIVLSLPTLRR